MSKRLTKINITLLGIIILLTSGCTPTREIINQPAQDLTISAFFSTMGAEGENHETGIFHYAATFYNTGNDDIYISSTLPVLSKNFAERLVSENILMIIDQNIAPGETLEIEDELRFDFQELSKKDIENLGEIIIKFKIKREDYLPLPGSL